MRSGTSSTSSGSTRFRTTTSGSSSRRHRSGRTASPCVANAVPSSKSSPTSSASTRRTLAAYSRATATIVWPQLRRSRRPSRRSGRSVHLTTATRSPASAPLPRASRRRCTAARMRCEATRADSRSNPMSRNGRLETCGSTLLVLAAIVATLVTPAGGSIGRRGALPTRLPGTLTVAVDIGTVGLAEGAIVNGTVVRAKGFEIDLARRLAGKLGAKLRIIDVPFARVFTPGSKLFDVSISHVTITAERAKSVDFSRPYFVVNKGVLVAPGVAPPATLAALRGLRICAQAATTSIVYVRTKLRPTAAPHSFPSPIDALRALSDGFCQAMIADLEILVAAKRDQPDLYGPIAGQIVTNERYGAVFEKGSRLRAPVGSALQSLARAGVLTRLATRWFGAGWDKAPVLR